MKKRAPVVDAFFMGLLRLGDSVYEIFYSDYFFTLIQFVTFVFFIFFKKI